MERRFIFGEAFRNHWGRFGVFLLLCLGPGNGFARSISDTLARAKDYNQLIKASSQRVVASEYRNSQAWLDLAPSFSAQYEYGTKKEDFTGGLSAKNKLRELTFTGELNLFNGFSDVSKIERTEQEERAQATNHNVVVQDILFQAVTTHILFVQNQTLLEIARSNVNTLERHNELVRSKRKLKAVTIADQSLAESRLAGASADLFEAEAELSSVREQYASLVGDEPKDLVLPEVESLKVPDQRAFESGIKRFNPRILESGHRTAAAQALSAEFRGQLWPKLDLFTEFNQSESRSVFRNVTGDTWLVSLKLNLPVLNRLSIFPRVSEVRALQEIAEYDAARVAVSIQAEASANYLAMQKAKQALDFREAAAKSARSTFDSYLQQYNAGARSTEDVLNVQRDFFLAQRSEIIAKAKYLTLYYKNLSLFGFLK